MDSPGGAVGGPSGAMDGSGSAVGGPSGAMDSPGGAVDGPGGAMNGAVPHPGTREAPAGGGDHPAGAREAQCRWALCVSWIRCHDFGRTGALAGLSSAARACEAAGFDGVNSQVSKSEASGLPDTFSA